MRLRTYLLLCLPLLISFPAEAQFGKILGKVSDQAKDILNGGELGEEQIGSGLKEALNLGVDKAVTQLSAEDGYLGSPYKILLPPEAQAVVNKVSALPGFGNVERDLTERLNRAAEQAATKAAPIFVDAITGLTIKDAMNLLMGENDAATRYLESSTTGQLTTAFQPVIKSSLDEVNATDLWKQIVTAYNRIPFVKKTHPELDVYVTSKALGGMFGLIEVKETELRDNPAMRNTELLRDVFARQDR